jgi:hypothetical protein
VDGDLLGLMQDNSKLLLQSWGSMPDFLNHNLDLYVKNVFLNDVLDVSLGMNFDDDDSLLNSLDFLL